MLRHKHGSIQRASQFSSLDGNGGENWDGNNWAAQHGEKIRRGNLSPKREAYNQVRVEQPHFINQPVNPFAKYHVEHAQRVRRGNQPSIVHNEYQQTRLQWNALEQQPTNVNAITRSTDLSDQRVELPFFGQHSDRISPTARIHQVRRKRGCSDLAQSASLDSILDDNGTQSSDLVTEDDSIRLLKTELTTAQLITATLRGVEDWHQFRSNSDRDSRQHTARYLLAKKECLKYLKRERKRHELRALGIRCLLAKREDTPVHDEVSQLSSDSSERKDDEDIYDPGQIYDDALQPRRSRECFFPPCYYSELERDRGGNSAAVDFFDQRETGQQRAFRVAERVHAQRQQEVYQDARNPHIHQQQQQQAPTPRPRSPSLNSANKTNPVRDVDGEKYSETLTLLPTVFTGNWNPPPRCRKASWGEPPAAIVKGVLEFESTNKSTLNGGNDQQQQQSREPVISTGDSLNQIAANLNNLGITSPQHKTFTVRIPVGSKQKRKPLVSRPAIIVALDIVDDDPITNKNSGPKMEGVLEYHDGAEEDEYEDLPDEEDEEMGESGVAMGYVDSDGDMEDEDQDDLDAVPVAPFNPVAMGLKEINGLAHFRVSSYKPGNGVPDLMSDDLDRYWQSDGIQPHRLTMTFVKAVEIRAIRFYVNFEQDESYTPTRIEWLAGTSLHDLHQFATSTLLNPRDWIDVPLTGTGGGEDGNSLVAWVVQMVILENHQNGKDTHIRGVRVYGFDDQLRAAGPTGSVDALEKARREEFRVDETKDGDENEKALVAHIRATEFVKEFSAGDPSGTASSLDFMEDPQLR